MTEEQKKRIDGMSQYELCKMWRFSESDPLLEGETGAYFAERLWKHFGGFTPEISKQIGW